MKREPGFYWVKFEGKWIIGHFYLPGRWDVMNWLGRFQDYDFESIHETRLIPPNENRKREQRQNLIDLMKTDEENGMYD